MALTGNETLQVLGQDQTGFPAATTETTTTGAIAALASLDSSSNVITALNTVGAGTITAAGIVGRITKRGGSQSSTPFTDTTATAAAIIALLPSGAPVSTSFQWTYYNTTNANATLTGGTGATVSGVTVIPPNGFARYLVTYSAAATVTIVGFEIGGFSADATDSTKVIAFSASSEGTAHTATIAAANSSDATYTLPAATDTLVGRASTDTLTNKTLTDAINTDAKVSTAQLNAVSTTTLAPVTGLAVALTSSGTYQIQASLPVSTNSTAGVAVGLVSSNSLTATSMTVTGKFFTATTAATVNTTTLGGSIGSTTSVILAELSGTIVVNTGGTLLVEAAQNVSTTGTASILTNAWLQVTRVS